MLDSPPPGFTGTVWEAVPPEQLVREVSTGPGATPMAEAGLAYGVLAAGLSEAATEFRAILSVLGDAWTSSSSTDGLNQLAALAGWLDRTAEAAQANAAHATRQACAYQTARTAVPHLVQVAETVRAAEDLVRGSLAGSLLAGLLDTAEHQLDDIRQQAARAMRSYESASARLAHPWRQDGAPEVSAGANLLAEQSHRTPTAAPAAEGTPVTPQPQHTVADFLQLDPATLPTIPAAPTVPVGSEILAAPVLPLPGAAATAPVPTALQPAPAQAVPATPLAPPVPVATAQAPTTSPRAVASDTGGAADTIVVNAGFTTAPAVLGVTAPTTARQPATPHSESR